MQVANSWIRRLSRNKLTYWVQYHADQDLAEIAEYWAVAGSVDPGKIRLQRKSNSNQTPGPHLAFSRMG